VLLVAWGQSVARTWVQPLEAAGFNVVVEDRDGQRAYRWAREHRPAVVIDGSTLPSHGRELANSLLTTAWGRTLPVILTNVTDSDREKTERKAPGARAILPAPTGADAILSLLASLTPAE
jgi:DNA-binding NarL/FixJ family response regulator